MQLVEYINNLIENNTLNISDRLPSLNQLTVELSMSKETVLKGLNYLSEKGIIESEYRKGYYVKKKAQYRPYRVCLILDKMNVLRDQVYHSFLETIKENADVEVYFHHHNIKVFTKLVEENLNNYTHFVIVTFFKENVTGIINKIPEHKRILIDHREKDLTGEFSCIYQDHKSDIFDSLASLTLKINKYHRLVLVVPSEAFHSKDILEGFEIFCKQHKKPYVVSNSLDSHTSKKGDLYITFSRYDQDDVTIIKIARKNGWKIGKDIGLISYNDTAVKEVLENGITVITTDFNRMGEEAAKAIICKNKTIMRIPAKVILRKSV
jgi:DNA-binding transcriptional regulator YhcF (GntR family)